MENQSRGPSRLDNFHTWIQPYTDHVLQCHIHVAHYRWQIIVCHLTSNAPLSCSLLIKWWTSMEWPAMIVLQLLANTDWQVWLPLPHLPCNIAQFVWCWEVLRPDCTCDTNDWWLIPKVACICPLDKGVEGFLLTPWCSSYFYFFLHVLPWLFQFGQEF